MITKDQLLGVLEREYLLLNASKRAEMHELRPMIARVRDAYAEAIEGFGDVADAAAMNKLCGALQQTHDRLAEGGVRPEVLKRMETIRRQLKAALQVDQGWKREDLVKSGQPTATGMRGLDDLRASMSIERLQTEGREYLSADELRCSLAIASTLGEVALADFWSAVAPERFAFDNRTIQNLRRWIGDVDAYGGNVLEDVPVPLLTLPSLSSLRELLFNHMRDHYFHSIYKDSADGANPVIDALVISRGKAEGPARQQFIDELVDYYVALEDLPVPDRLRPALGAGTEFPGKHQKVAMLEIERKRQLLLADRMGGGKTGSSIAAFERLRDRGLAKRCLVVCPGEVVGEWEKRLTDRNGGYFKEGHMPNVVVIRAGDRDRAAAWERAKTADYVLMSIELSREETRGISHEKRAMEIGADFFIVDEAHNVRNPDGADTERIFRISQCESILKGYTVVSTGTPVYNTIRDVAAQLRLLNAGQQRTLDGEAIPRNVDFTDIKSLSRAISRNHTRLVRNLLLLRMLRRDTQDCLPIDATLEVQPPLETPFTPLEQAVYDALYDDPYFHPLRKIEMLTRACLHPSRDGFVEGMHVMGETKYRQLRQVVDEVVAEFRAGRHSGKMLFAVTDYAKGLTRDFKDNHDPATSEVETYLAGRLRAELAKEGIPVLILDRTSSGSKPLSDERDIDGAPMTATRKVIAACRDHQGPAVLFAQARVIGEGIDLTFMARGYMVSPTSVKPQEDQIVGRLYRPGQKHDVRFRSLMIPGTIEEGKRQFALRKERIIKDLLNGRPLTRDEEQLLNEETGRIRRGGFLSYETKSPRQRAIHIFKHILAAGKERVREFFALDGGRYAQELAAIYAADEETSYQGNNRRLLLSVLRKHAQAAGGTMRVADVACGTMALARSLRDDPRFEVHSSDICEAMVEAGRQTLGHGREAENSAVCSMDELPYEDGSMDAAVLSLALHYTAHNPRKKATGGDERINALCEFNRVLRDGGIGILALPPYVVRDAERFRAICEVLETYFGFEVVVEDTGCARSTDQADETRFESYVITVRKVGRPHVITLPLDAWNALDLRPEKKDKPDREERVPRRKAEPAADPTESAPGSFHERFAIGGQELSYDTPNPEIDAREGHRAEKRTYQHIHRSLELLIAEHGTIADIPAEKLLSLSLVEIDAGEQELRDRYFRELLERHEGRIDRIPLEEISARSPVILLRGRTKRGPFVCLARVEGGQPCGYGKQYFYEEELASRN